MNDDLLDSDIADHLRHDVLVESFTDSDSI
jgi:hypothetical protein